MTQRTKVIDTLSNYFEEKGRVLSAQEYIREESTPIRYQVLRKMFSSWPKMERMIMARREYLEDREPITDVDAVLKKRNQDQIDFEERWKNASENQEEKMKKEAEAKSVAEKLAKNAATPEGANANKLAAGGPLPEEQPKIERSGATVNIDPKTKERTVVDTNPEEVDSASDSDDETGDTPEELKEKVDAKDGDVKTGKDTSSTAKGSAPASATKASK